MAGWHHQCNEHEFGQTLEDGEGQGGLACCSPWGHKELDMTGQLNNNIPVGTNVLNSLVTSWTAAHQASLSLTISRSLPKFMSLCQ